MKVRIWQVEALAPYPRAQLRGDPGRDDPALRGALGGDDVEILVVFNMTPPHAYSLRG